MLIRTYKVTSVKAACCLLFVLLLCLAQSVGDGFTASEPQGAPIKLSACPPSSPLSSTAPIAFGLVACTLLKRNILPRHSCVFRYNSS